MCRRMTTLARFRFDMRGCCTGSTRLRACCSPPKVARLSFRAAARLVIEYAVNEQRGTPRQRHDRSHELAALSEVLALVSALDAERVAVARASLPRDADDALERELRAGVAKLNSLLGLRDVA